MVQNRRVGSPAPISRRHASLVPRTQSHSQPPTSGLNARKSVTLWCCPPHHHCLRAACCVAVGRLHVVPCCSAAHITTTTTTCALPVMLPSGGCMLCRTVVLPASPPLPAHCLPCCRWVVACHATLWCCLHCHCCHHLHAACCVAIGWLRVMPHCGAARIATTATAACTLPVMLPSGGVVLQGAAARPHHATVGQLHVMWR